MIITSTLVAKRNRLLVRKGDEYISLPVEEIALIYRSDAVVFVIDYNEKKYLCEKNLTLLEQELDETLFFRANRQYLININSIRGFKVYEKVKLQVFLKGPLIHHEIIISQKTAPVFKKWISEEG